MLPHLPNEVLEAVPRYLVITHLHLLRQVGPQDVHAHLEVGLVEVIRDVPPDLAILAALLHDCVEEREHKHEGGECLVGTLEQRQGRDLEVRAAHVQLEAIWRLSDNLQ